MHDNGYVEYVLELLFDLGGIKAKKMFGGYGIYQNGVFFALIIQDVLYFKVDDTNRADYQAHGSQAFTYQGKSDKPVTMSYWQVPIDVLEDPHLLAQWASKSVRVAMRIKKK